MYKIRNRKKNKGFSLVELVIVIAIMAILAGILIPQFVKYISSSKVSGDIQQSENIYNAVAAAYADSQGDATKAGLTFDGKMYYVDDSVATALEMGSAAPACKVNTAYGFYYSCDNKGAVAVYVTTKPADDGTGGRNGQTYAPGTDTKLSPAIEGANAADWGGKASK